MVSAGLNSSHINEECKQWLSRRAPNSTPVDDDEEGEDEDEGRVGW